MPNDYCVNQVKFGDTMVMDISDTTASPEDVAEGEIFYAADGARSVGTGAGGGYVLPVASANTLGGIKVGSNLSIDNNGVLSSENTEYSEGNGIDIFNTTISLDMDYLTASRLEVIPTSEKGAANGVATLNENSKIPNAQLPTASENTLGGIKVGNNLSIDNNGVLSAVGGGTTYTAGDGIDIDNTTIALDIDYLTASRLGVIPTTEKGINGGVATLNENGKIPNAQLPIASENVLGGIKVGNNLSIDSNGVLSADGGGQTITVSNKGQAGASTIAYQALTINSVDYKIDGSIYMEQTMQVTANTDTSFTFTNVVITTDSAIDLWASIYGIAPKSVTVTNGSCVVVFNINNTTSLTCRIYIRNNTSN